jgi:5-(carboxyamino)imidazole ribonucleotide mutase
MKKIQIGVVMGSSSDWDTMQHAVQILQHFCVGFEAGGVVAGSASITPAGQSNNITLNSSKSNGLPAITLNANDQAGGPGFGASVVGQNIGTESLQTQGTRKSITSNRLSVF